MSVARAQLSQTDLHTATADRPFGLLVYGIGPYTHYVYPGGLNLAPPDPGAADAGASP